MDTHHAIEFVHSTLAAGVSEARLVDAMLAFEERVLGPRGFLFHALLRNEGSRYAHFVVAPRHECFAEVERDAASVPEVGALFACLDGAATRLFRHRVLGEARPLPRAFGVLEHGIFQPSPRLREESELEEAGRRVRDEYLATQPGYLAQFVSDAGDGRYAEVVFGVSPAHARVTCARYLQTPACAPLLALCEPATVELDYWTPLVLRSFGAAS